MNDFPLRYLPRIEVTEKGALTRLKKCIASSVSLISVKYMEKGGLTILRVNTDNLNRLKIALHVNTLA